MPLNIIVCIKQVPDTNDMRIDPKTNNLIREGVPSVVNPTDLNAIEEALRFKDTFGANVSVLTMGPPQAEQSLRESIAMGADQAVDCWLARLICSFGFGHSARDRKFNSLNAVI